MAVSGSFNFTQNRDNLIKDAFVEAGILRPDETPDYEENSYAANTLNRMLKSWFQFGLHLFAIRDATLFLETDKIQYSLGPTGDHCTESFTETAIKVAASTSATSIDVDSTTGMSASDYIGIELDSGAVHWTTISSVTDSDTVVIASGLASAAAVDNVVYFYTNKIQRPLRINHAYYRDHTTAEVKTDTRMYEISRDEYLSLSAKNTESRPTEYYFDPQLTNCVLNIYGEPTDVKDTIVLAMQFPFDDMDAAANDFSFPVEWLDAIHLNLAARLASAYRQGGDAKTMELTSRAVRALEQAKGFDEERSDLQIVPDPRWIGDN